MVHEIQLSIVEDSQAGELATSVQSADGDWDPELTATLRRRRDALQRGEAQTLTRDEMKLRLARRRASPSSR